MAFDVAALLLCMPNDLPRGSVKSVPQCDVSILMCIVVDDDFVSRNVQIKAYIECIALMFVMVWLFNRDVAACQIGMAFFERFDFFTDVILERLGTGHAMKCDVQWYRHVWSPINY